MKRVLLGLLLVLGVIALGGCAGRELRLGAQDDGRQVELNVGQTLTISLEANPTTGYTWAVQPLEEEILEQVGKPSYKPSAKRVGAGGTQTFRFRAVAPGKVELRLIYCQPWAKGQKPAKTFTCYVQVR